MLGFIAGKIIIHITIVRKIMKAEKAFKRIFKKTNIPCPVCNLNAKKILIVEAKDTILYQCANCYCTITIGCYPVIIE